MITIQQDPSNQDRYIVTQTLTLYLDKLMLATLSDELAAVIAQKAREDFKKPAVVKELRRLTTEHLAKLLGYVKPPTLIAGNKTTFNYEDVT